MSLTRVFQNNTREFVRFIKFAVVGAVGFFVDAGVFNLLISMFGMAARYSQMVSFTIAVCNNFLWNRYWTYPDSRTKPLARQLGQFFIVNLAGFAIRTVIFILIEEPFIHLYQLIPSVNSDTAVFFGHNTSLATVVVIVMMWNFFVNRYWTYNDVK